jgi:putative colanic acid biosynthesis UDP-glucose lipid carrier transferase
MAGSERASNTPVILTIVLHLQDWAAVIGSAFLAHRYYLETWELFPSYDMAILVALVLATWLFSLNRLYDGYRGAPLFAELRQLWLAWTGVFLVLALLATLTKTGAAFSRGWGMLWYLIGYGLLASLRAITRSVLSRLRAHGVNVRRIVVVGTADTVKHLMEVLHRRTWAGYTVVAAFAEGDSPADDDKDISGRPREAAAYVMSNPVDEVWIALPLHREALVADILDSLRNTTVDVRYVPDFFGIRLINHSVSSIAGLSVINLSSTPMVGASRLLKAVEDRAIAVVALLLLGPLMLFIAVAVRLSSPGPALYRQERVGWNGEPFTMYKFRSMPVDVEEHGVTWGGAREKETTRLGALLRRTSLDELPQFINVLLGDMSVVGPRPERTEFVESFKDQIPGYMKKHIVKAGITGWAQVHGWRGDTDLSKRIEYDLYYIENWSLWLDLRIILMTLFKGMASETAY